MILFNGQPVEFGKDPISKMMINGGAFEPSLFGSPQPAYDFAAKWRELYGMNTPTTEKLVAFSQTLPSFGCSCSEHFLGYMAEHPPDFNDWFAWCVEAHNAVNIRQNKRVISLAEAKTIHPQFGWRGQKRISNFVAVTSLAPHRFERQSVCLDSWKQFGLDVISVNRQAEIESMASDYPQVAKWIAAEFEVTPKINSLLDVAVAEDTAILIINSDIEIYGDQSRLTDLVCNRKNGFGIRHNYETHPGDATIEQWGLDAFLVYPAQVRRLSRVEFSIGKPMWDYWLPWELEQIEECEWITIPYFFHRSHPVAWTQEECTSAHEAFAAQFGPMDWTQWRGARPRD